MSFDVFKAPCGKESTIMLGESSQGENSVMRLRFEGRKKPIRVIKNPLWIHMSRSEYALARSKYTLARSEDTLVEVQICIIMGF